MTSTQPTLQWSEKEPPAEVPTVEHLDQIVDRLAASARPDIPISVRLQVHGCEVDLLLGRPESFVYITDLAARRYYTTVGDLYVDGGVNFWLLEQHHTEFERRHLIPRATARAVFREFFQTGQRSASVEWEEGCY
jgi:hypothetical protein